MAGVGLPAQGYPEPEDIYESLPQDEEDFGPPSSGVPAPGLPLPNAGGFRYPAPSLAPPPPPSMLCVFVHAHVDYMFMCVHKCMCA